RGNRKSKSKRILVPKTVHPKYRATAQTIVKHQGITLETLDYDPQGGHTNVASLPKDPGDFTALVVASPNFFGTLEDVDELTQWAHSHNALVIAVVNPTSLALLNPPGQWGDSGADICCGEGQPLGIPLASGGPYFGFLCCKQDLVRQMPGRIVGRTVDQEGKEGFTLTLQAREQHIRRSKATSNICTNQGLMVTAATIYMSIMGPEGLKQTAMASHANLNATTEALSSIGGVDVLFDRPRFHEAVIKLSRDSKEVIKELAKQNIVGGVDLSRDFPELGNALLICATETKTAEDISVYANAMKSLL
ncbi:MAG: aminomethyl-transferring glycine dehydrogenase subunit GcvPA, partial [Gammaproteobacteria bacterium]|nr:aminomethyl-transferring glycine dehydrogenase subunit GcvPA [Gammaproteobacteria bacterium]